MIKDKKNKEDTYKYIEIKPGKIELTIPNIYHKIVTQALNPYMFKIKDPFAFKTLYETRDALLSGYYNLDYLLFKLDEVSIRLLNIPNSTQDMNYFKHIMSTLLRIAEEENLKKLAKKSKNIVSENYHTLTFNLKRRVHLIHQKPASFATAIIYSLYKRNKLHRKIIEKNADKTGKLIIKMPHNIKFGLYIKWYNYYKILKIKSKKIYNKNNNIMK